ncbi:MAG: hypothetical protein AAF403_01870 [Pseudomonadota bacterium]
MSFVTTTTTHRKKIRYSRHSFFNIALTWKARFLRWNEQYLNWGLSPMGTQEIDQNGTAGFTNAMLFMVDTNDNIVRAIGLDAFKNHIKYIASYTDFASLPPVAGVSDGTMAFVETSTGVILTPARKPKGFYIKLGTEWKKAVDVSPALVDLATRVTNLETSGGGSSGGGAKPSESDLDGLTVYQRYSAFILKRTFDASFNLLTTGKHTGASDANWSARKTLTYVTA